MTLHGCSRGWWREENQVARRLDDMPAEGMGVLGCDWADEASPPHGLSIVVAFPTRG